MNVKQLVHDAYAAYLAGITGKDEHGHIICINTNSVLPVTVEIVDAEREIYIIRAYYGSTHECLGEHLCDVTIVPNALGVQMSQYEYIGNKVKKWISWFPNGQIQEHHDVDAGTTERWDFGGNKHKPITQKEFELMLINEGFCFQDIIATERDGDCYWVAYGTGHEWGCLSAEVIRYDEFSGKLSSASAYLPCDCGDEE